MSNSQWFKKFFTVVITFMVTLGCLPQLFIQALAENEIYTIRFHAYYTDDYGDHNGNGGGEIQVTAGDSIGDSEYLYPTFEGGAIQYWSDSRDYWYSSSGNQAYQGSNFYTPEEVKDIVPTSDIDFYAHYAYTVTVDYAGGIDSLGQTSTTLVLPELQAYYIENLEIPVRNDSKIFKGWTNESSYNTLVYFTPTAYDHKLTAQWEDGFKVTLYANGGTFDDGSTEHVVINESQKMYTGKFPQPVNADQDKSFKGWERANGEILSSDNWYDFEDGEVLNAFWSEPITVTIDNGVGDSSSYTLYSGESLGANSYIFDDVMNSAIPPTGKTFAGYSTNSDGSGTRYSSTTINRFILRENITFYMIWDDPVTVTFHAGDYGDFGAEWDDNSSGYIPVKTYSTTIGKGGKTCCRELSSYDGYYCEGWSFSSDGTGEVYTSFQVEDILTFEENTDLYAVYTEFPTISIDFNGGIDNEGNTSLTYTKSPGSYFYYQEFPSVSYEDGSKLFVGWSTNQSEYIDEFELVEDPSYFQRRYLVNEDVTFYAIWEDAFVVTFHAGENGYFEKYNPSTGEYDHVSELKKPASKGGSFNSDFDDPHGIDCFFKGWSLNADGSGEIYEQYQLYNAFQFDSDKDFYAVYDSGYTLTFDFNGGSDSDSNTSINMKWEKDTYLYWENTPREVTYPGGTKTLAGWSTSPDDQTNLFERTYDSSGYYGGNIYVTEDRTLYAIWEDSCVVTLHSGNNGYLEEIWDDDSRTYSYVYDKTYTVAKGTRLSYMDINVDDPTVNLGFFLGWSKNEDGSGELFTSYNLVAMEIQESTDFYAVYDPGCEIIFDFNGAVNDRGLTSTSIRKRKNEYIDEWYLGTIIGDNYVSYPGESKSFIGWSSSPSEYIPVLEYYEDDSYSENRYYVVEDDTLYAWWESTGAEEVAITFDYNGGADQNNNTSRTFTYAPGTTLKLYNGGIPQPDDPNPNGRVFLGWSTSPNSYEEAFAYDESQGNSFYQCNADATLYAVWDAHRIIFDSNGGYFFGPNDNYGFDGGLPQTVDDDHYMRRLGFAYAYNEKISSRPNNLIVQNDDEEAVLAGWNTKADGTGEYIDITSDYIVKEDMTLYAQWMDHDSIVITKQPEDIYAGDGETVVLSVEAQGSDLTYTWYFRNKGKTSWSRSTETSPQYTMEMNEARDGRQMYCIVGNASGKTVTSETATFHFLSGPVITSQPEDVYAIDGEQTIVSVEALGSNLTYTWYFRNAGKTAWSKSSETSSQYRMEMSAARDGRQTYCVVKDSAGNTAESNIVTYHLMIPLEITSQPESATVRDGQQLDLSIEATGIEVAYRWQYLEIGSAEWADSGLPGYDTDTLTVTLTEDKSGQQYRCIVTDKYGTSIESDIATVEVIPAIVITKQPEDVYAEAGETTVVSIEADGEDLTYAWYFRNAGKTAWTKSSETSSQYMLEMTEARDGRQTYCIVKNASGKTVTSDTATYHYVETLAITRQPEDVHATSGEQTVVSVEATGRGLTYTWYFRNKGKTAWTKSSETSGRYMMEMTEARDGRQTYCVVRDSAGNTAESNVVTYHLMVPLEITSQPIDATAVENNAATFSIAATGEELAYQWQYLENGAAEWADSGLPGSDTDTITVLVTPDKSGQQYRCVVTDKYGETATSDAATLTVVNAVAITSEPEDVYAFDGEQTVVSVGAEGEGLTYTWYYRNAGKTAWSRSSETSSQYRMEMTEARDGRQTYCIVRDAGGNSARSRTVTYHLKTPLAVTAQPANAAVIEGNAATFTVEADGDGLAYQWETSTDNINWSAVSGATANEYTVTAQLSQSGTYYRCVITDAYGESVETNAVQLLVANGNETPIDEPAF